MLAAQITAGGKQDAAVAAALAIEYRGAVNCPPIRLFSINVFGVSLAFRKFTDNYQDRICGDPLLWVYLRHKEPEDPKRRFGDSPRSFSS
jgi:hypothetical protein